MFNLLFAWYTAALPTTNYMCYLGIGANNSYMHVMFGFEDRNGGPGLDESKILSFTIPVNEVEEFE